MFRAILLVVVLSLVFNPAVSTGDVLNDIDSVLNNFSTYYQPPGYVRGPGSNYINFGAFRTFVPRHNYQLLSLTPPSFRATCGGIDVFMGGFSFINLDQFPQMLQQIMSSAAGYFFQLAIEQLCPTCANVLSVMRHASQLANKFALDSCNTGHMLAKSAIDAISADTEKETLRQKTETNHKSWLENLDSTLKKVASGDLSDVGNTLSKWKAKAGDPTAPELHFGNLVFLALKKIHPTTAAEEAELAMSVMGTYVVKGQPSDELPTVDTLEPTIDNPEVLIRGCAGDECSLPYGGQCNTGEIPMWHCDTTDECLNPTPTCKTPSEVIVSKISQKLRSLIDKMLTNEEPTPEEKSLYFYTPYLSELYNAIHTYKNDTRNEILYSFADGLGSKGLAYLMLRDMLTQVYGGVSTQISAIHFAKNIFTEGNKQVLYENYRDFLKKTNREIQATEQEIQRKVQIYASLKGLNYQEAYESATKSYRTQNVVKSKK